MARFTADNTEGYSAADITYLNEAFGLVTLANHLPTVAPEGDLGTGSVLDHIAERLFAAYDNGARGDELIATCLPGRTD